MKRVFHTIVLAFFCLVASARCASAQDWRQENPNQPNGYRASEAASHYHGNLQMPEYQQNGYRASEARSHYGGMRMEPSDGWHYDNDSGPGSAFRNDYSSSGGPGSAFSNASAFHSGGPENTYAQRMRRSNQWQQGYRNLRAAGYTPGAGISAGYASNYGSPQGYPQYRSFSSRLSTYGPAIEREQQLRQRAIQNVESGSGFNRIYGQ